MVDPRRPAPAACTLVVALTFTLAAACRHKEPPAPAPKLPPPRPPAATLFDHAMLSGIPARPKPDCSPEALMAAARHVGELELLASGDFKLSSNLSSKLSSPGAKSIKATEKAKAAKARSAACPTPEAQLAMNEVKGKLPERVSSCMSQDAPFDAEWDMVNSAVIALSACLDCARTADDRAGRCRWVADQVKRAELSVKGRMGK